MATRPASAAVEDQGGIIWRLAHGAPHGSYGYGRRQQEHSWQRPELEVQIVIDRTKGRMSRCQSHKFEQCWGHFGRAARGWMGPDACRENDAAYCGCGFAWANGWDFGGRMGGTDGWTEGMEGQRLQTNE
jgi:hypothetical protein